MKSAMRCRVGVLTACVVTASFGFAASAIAGPPDAVFDFPAGSVCEFALRIELRGGDQPHFRQFYDKDGNVVRTILAGKGSALTFINESPPPDPGSGATLSLKANGFSDHQTFNPDGTITDTTLGHVVVLLGPTDVPAGPSTTLYVGRLVISIDSANVYTLQSFSGKKTDICAALE